ncbi:hypothetical protein B5M47_01760 [candidate division CPR3 bacterium 4484_211]|uniref:AAA+ ATPase domain-containing protein n=1 Tax=candidate division CPR3 bacterium 4484_211 TaxID=1968527 RepID=A0A1W9NYC3_UNCC3|nr:MAG: hypothetical protein B5M47_01760 [candidate division CPR3 bacterium 4484_211]
MSNNTLAKNGYVSREIEAEIEKLLPLPQIIALVGPRRSGKTTLLLRLQKKLKKASYLSFEDREVLTLFEQDIKNFAKIYLERETQYLFLDEFHYAQKGGKNLKYLFDYYPNKKIIISGSSTADLTIRAIKFLVGRVLVLTLYPFSFGEFLSTKDREICTIWETTSAKELGSSPLKEKLKQIFEEYLVFGGYPEVVLQKDEETKKTLLNNIYSILFLREIKDFLTLSEDYKLKNLIQALALQIGNIVNYQELGQISGLDYKTLKRYLNFLEKVFLCQLIPPFFTNKRKELVKAPKVYFWDNGLANSVIKNFSPLSQRPNAGAILENAAFGILDRETEVKFWRTKAKAEVDFILEGPGGPIPVEIKLGIKTPKISSSLRSFIKTYQPKKAIVGTLSFWGKRFINQTQVLFQPLWKFDIQDALTN